MLALYYAYYAKYITSDEPLNNDLGCMDPYACNYDPEALEDDGSCAYEEDCAGECGGDAYVDDCGICDGFNQDMDCSGECFGDAYVDDCGVCDGGNQDVDDCGVCFGNNEDMDCAGVCFGYAEVDECGVCEGDNSTCTGCADPEALNYDSEAIIDEGCCVYHEEVPLEGLADLNNDGAVNIFDAIIMVDVILGM